MEAELAHWEELGALYLVSQYMRSEGRGVWSPGQQSQTCDDFIIHPSLPRALWTALEAMQLFPFPNIVF